MGCHEGKETEIQNNNLIHTKTKPIDTVLHSSPSSSPHKKRVLKAALWWVSVVSEGEFDIEFTFLLVPRLSARQLGSQQQQPKIYI